MVAILLVAVLLRVVSESNWIGTLLLFSPRWMFALPLFVLIPVATWKKRTALIPLALAGLIWLVPLSGLRTNWPRSGDTHPPGGLRVITCNMQGGGIDYLAFNAYLQETQPDIVLLQEWTDGHRAAAFRDDEWKLVESGGLWVASRLPITAIDGLPRGRLPLSAAAGGFRVETAYGEVQIVNVHLPTPRDGISAVLHRRLRGIAALEANTAARREVSAVARQFCSELASVDIVAGDFNMPVESSIYRADWGDLRNAFSDSGFGWGGTKQTNWHSVRIDHVLFSPAWKCIHASVGPNVGSDHRPVFAVLEPAG
jgi:vancomycin resistance protein VanJ